METATTKGVFWLGLVCAFEVVVIDQAHKLWSIFVLGMGPHDRYAVLPFLDVIYVINPGISYGMFAMDSQMGQYLLAGFAGIVAVGLMIWLARGTHSRLSGAAIGLIAGGAVGNAIDRLYLGGVADFFSFHAFGFYWYVFNISDVAIVAGVIGLLYESFVSSRKGAANHT